jgi:two-component system, OmpR family, phosphate regulon sensor histidine kinase PhoR
VLQHVLLSVKNSVTLGLVLLSVVLLLVLQAFWLHNSYENAYFDLRRESTMVFRSTVFQLRDSLYANTLNASDSSFQMLGQGAAGRIQMVRSEGPVADSLIFRAQPSTVQVFISSDGPSDSLIKNIGPITSRLRKLNSGSRTITIRIAPDSLPVDSLSHYFTKNLLKESIPAKVRVFEASEKRMAFPAPGFTSEFWRIENEEQKKSVGVFQDTLKLSPVPLNPHTRYAASLTGMQGIVLKKITPQIAFSVFLTLTIITAFGFMYRTLRSQQKLMALKNDFISNITHELKTPVATVSVALEALQNFDVSANPERGREYLAIAQQELVRLSAMTDKVLKTTLLEEHGMSISKEPLDLEILVRETLSSMKVLIEKQHASVTLEKQGDYFMVSGSAVHLASVITNLVENSLKYTTGTPAIAITLSQHNASVKLSIKDNGMGIGPEYHTKVFEKFFRVPTGNIHTVKGYGLGLSYVAGVVKAHSGQIELKSIAGEGSEFITSFPVHPAP